MLPHNISLTIFLASVLLLSSFSVSAETYSWVDENGTASFTDDPSKIPQKYRKSETSTSPAPQCLKKQVAAGNK